MSMFEFNSLSKQQINELVALANASYAGETPPSSWRALEGSELGFVEIEGWGIYVGDTFYGEVPVDTYNAASLPAGAGVTTNSPSAQVYQKGSELTISFRGTDGGDDALSYYELISGINYLNYFDSLLEAVSLYVQDLSNGIRTINIVGHSLGAAAANTLSEISDRSYQETFEQANYLTIASPKIYDESQILNIGFENDLIFKIIPSFSGQDKSSSTDNIVLHDNEYANSDNIGIGLSAHGAKGYINAVERITQSQFYDKMDRDSVVVVVATDAMVTDRDVSTSDHFGADTYYIGVDEEIKGVFNDQTDLSPHDFIVGGAGNDSIDAMGGNDILNGGGGENVIDGGEGIDLWSPNPQNEVQFTVETDYLNKRLVTVETILSNGQAKDHVTHVEGFLGGLDNDLVILPSDFSTFIANQKGEEQDSLEFHLDAGDDTVDLSQLTEAVSLTGTAGQLAVIKDTQVKFFDFETLKLPDFDNKIELSHLQSSYVNIVAGSGNDTIKGAGGFKRESVESDNPSNDNPNETGVPSNYNDHVSGGTANDDIPTAGLEDGPVINATIDLGGGDDVVEAVARGTIITTGDGEDQVATGDVILYTDLDENDKIYEAGRLITGAVKSAESDSPWAHGHGNLKMALNDGGELVIEDLAGFQTFIANADVNPHSANRTAGIMAFELEIEWKRLLDPDLPKGLMDTYDRIFLGYYLKAMTGESRYEGVDPLSLDLDGDGLELTPLLHGVSQPFDMDGDGFAEPTGWIKGDDGLLVLDANGDGEVNDIGELFGSPTQSGFDELSEHDDNNDGVIDASDSVYTSLDVWQDYDQNRKVDDGELNSLSHHGIESISLANSTPNSDEIAGNRIDSQSSFTLSDGSSQGIYDVRFRIDNFASTWLGDDSVSTQASLLPNLKGRGEVTDLHVAMTLDPTLASLVDSSILQMTTPDMAQLRQLTTQILNQWGDDPLVSRPDIPMAIAVGLDGKRTGVEDFGIPLADGSWALASGLSIYDGDGVVIDDPTYDDVITFAFAGKDVEILTGEELAFMERYFGETLPFDQVSAGHSDAAGGAAGLMDMMDVRLDVLAVRLAVQGPMANSYFQGITYDVETDSFMPTTDRHLIPVYEAIFANSPADPGGAESFLASWKPMLDVIIGDYVRGEDGQKNTYSFLFGNIVAAFESTGSALDIETAAEALGIPEGFIIHGTGDLHGTDGYDIFYLDQGDEVAMGGQGHDVYVVGRNFGQDVIRDVEGVFQDKALDMIRFADIKSSEVSARREGVDLYITVDATGDELKVERQFEGTLPGLFGGDFSDDTGVDEIVFADGEIWDIFEIARQVANPQDGDQLISGTDTIDFLDGGAGNDTLEGGNASDYYIFKRGYGHDVIEDLQEQLFVDMPDYVAFEGGITQDDLTFSRGLDYDDLVITIDDTGDTLTIKGQFNAAYTGVFDKQFFQRIEKFIFDDGTSLSWLDVMENMLEDAQTDGDDVIIGFSSDDTLEGGLGNDYLHGGDDQDTYIYNLGDGHDTIEEYWSQYHVLSGQNDKIVFGDKITPSNITLTRPNGGDDLVMNMSDGGSLTVKGMFQTNNLGGRLFEIERFEFSDGSYWSVNHIQTLLLSGSTEDQHIFGFFSNDTIDAGGGNDTLEGGDAGDTYVFGFDYGHNIVIDQQSSFFNEQPDRILFGPGVIPEDVTLSRPIDSNDLQITLSDGSTLVIQDQFYASTLNLKLNTIEQFEFEDGTLWTEVEIKEKLLIGTDGDDLLQGFFSDDVFDGGLGNDTMEGGDAGDHYHFDKGYGHDVIIDTQNSIFNETPDKVIFGPNTLTSDVIFTRAGLYNRDLVITIPETGDSLTIVKQFFTEYNRVEQFEFADGTQWSWRDVVAQMTGGTPGDDHLIGDDENNTITGGQGNDLLEGKSGQDTYIFGPGDGQDVIDDSQSQAFETPGDRLELDFASTDATFGIGNGGRDLVIHFNTGDRITIDDHFWIEYQRIEYFAFNDDITLTHQDVAELIFTGNDLNNTINGSYEDDLLKGLGGHDTLDGNRGNNTLYGGDGDDILKVGNVGTNWFHGEAGNDTVYMTGNNGYAWGGEGDDVFVDDLVNIGEIYGGTGIDRITLDTTYNDAVVHLGQGTATIGNKSRILQDIENYYGSLGDDTITGSNGANDLRGNNGDDILIGGLGNDSLYGNAHHDSLEGGDGDDSLLGQDGDDTINGGNGDDLISGGFGADLLDGGAGNDTVTYDYSTGDFDVDLSTGDAAGEIMINFENAIGSQGANRMIGDNGANILDGQEGNDTLIGGLGNDTLTGGGADDRDMYVLTAHWGQDVITDFDLAHDLIDLRDVGYQFSDLTLSALPEGTRIEDPSGNSITLLNVALDDVNTDHFLSDILGTAGNDTLTGTLYDDVIEGLDGDDRLEGAAGDDSLYGGEGDDLLIGHGGLDYFHGGFGNDTVDFSYAETGNIAINLATGIASWSTPETLISIENVIGTQGNNVITGSSAANRLDGGLGDDTIFGGDGDDTISGDFGADSLDGGNGIDTLTYAYSSADFEINLSTGSSAGETAINFENVIGSSGANTITGSGDANHIDGGAGDDFIDGREGADTLLGGAGNDTLSGHYGLDYFDGGEGSDWVDFTYSTGNFNVDLSQGLALFTTPETLVSIENIKGSSGVNTLTGDAGHNELDGFSGNDVIRGGEGNDTLRGGAHSDRYEYASGDGDDYIGEWNDTGAFDVLKLVDLDASDIQVSIGQSRDIDLVITDLVGGGSITIWSQFYYTSSNKNWSIEQVDFANGSSWNRATLEANAWMRGSDQDDGITGSARNDNIIGNAGNDSLDGGGGNDSIIGGDGDDWLSGGLGADSFDGGDGVDTLSVAYSSANWTIDLATGSANGETVINVENVEGGSGNDVIIGSSLNNHLAGGSGNDSLNGGEGDDILIGGIGVDHFQFSTAWGMDQIEDFEDGIDLIDFSMAGLSWNELAINQVNADSEITDGLGNFVRINGLQASLLSEADFILA